MKIICTSAKFLRTSQWLIWLWSKVLWKFARFRLSPIEMSFVCDR